MTKFRAGLSLIWGYKKNGHSGNGFLIIEEEGTIVVKSIARTDSLGRLGEIRDVAINKKKISFRNQAGDTVVLHLSKRRDAEAFYEAITVA